MYSYTYLYFWFWSWVRGKAAVHSSFCQIQYYLRIDTELWRSELMGVETRVLRLIHTYIYVYIYETIYTLCIHIHIPWIGSNTLVFVFLCALLKSISADALTTVVRSRIPRRVYVASAARKYASMATEYEMVMVCIRYENVWCIKWTFYLEDMN